MNSPRLPLLVLPFIALAAGAASRRAPSALTPVQENVRADSDTVVPAKVIQLGAFPLPVPDSIKPVRLNACFDIDSLGRTILLDYNLTRDKEYNKRIVATWREYQFRPATRLGVPVRDTICVKASIGH